jgi:DNA-binding NtrC family response regulator
MAQVLYIDDETDILELAEIHFKDKGLPIVTASTAQMALEIMGQNPIKVIISDARMPGLKGLELYQKLKHELNFQGHFILVSGHFEAMASDGVDLVLSKPIDFNELIRQVKKFLD